MTKADIALGRIPMAIKIEEVCSANEAFRELEALALRSSGDIGISGPRRR
jgi:hypothetical protein